MRISVVLLLFCLSLTARAELKIFACESDWASLAHELGGDKVDIYQATNGRQDVHHIQARPSLLAQARRAGLLICTGAELESGWLPVILRKTGNAKIRPGQPGHFMAADFVLLKGRPQSLDRSEGDIHAAGNPHIQTDPNNITKIAEALSQRLQQLDSANAGYYQTRHADFAQRWQAAIANWEQRAATLKELPIVVYHDGWIYLQDWLGLKKIAVLEPKPGIPPGSGHLSQVLQTLQKQPAKAVIHAAYQNSKAAQWLAGKTGVSALVLPNSVGGADSAENLFGLFDTIISRLLSAQ
ncbi:MAG: zinc ABC transporter solute-binding protein [Gammaproteobacteria bacterium]|nr:zinc ABC transporter solute-binding protein [Gammaproteobacteria bacterium]